jgi:GDP-mannose 6-dehydrogenase
MRVSVFGLGYVGAVTAACLARDGHHVVGVDANPDKVELIRKGKPPIVEQGLAELLAEGVRLGRIEATTDARKAVLDSEATLISVGTPLGRSGVLDMAHVHTVSRQVGAALQGTQRPHTVVLRSTVNPGTTAECARLLHESAGRAVPVAFNPEFLREGTALRDYDEPAYTVIGTTDAGAEAVVRELYASVSAPVFVVAPAIAELVKTVSNAWHATKVSFANEVGRLARAYGVNGQDLMGLFLQDTKLNASGAYMRPGFAYGGSCLPKDTEALIRFGRERGVAMPLLSAVPASNREHIDAAVAMVMAHRPRRVAVLGLAFKPGTDDLRHSASVLLCKALLGEGVDLAVHDRAVSEAHLMGTNLDYLRSNLPHFERLLVADPAKAVAGADVVVATQSAAELRQVVALAGPDVPVVDVAGLFRAPPEERRYEGIGW